MANFELVAVGVFEKNGVIARAVFKTHLRAFDVLRAGLANHFRRLVHGFAARGPERAPVSLWPMIGLFRESEEVDRDLAFRFEQAPLVAALVHPEPDRRQNLRVEALGRLAIFNPKIDVIEKTPAHETVFTARPACLLASVLAADHQLQTGP